MIDKEDMMQVSLKSSILGLSMVGVAILVSGEPGAARENKFFCTREGGVPVTKVRTARGNETFIIWERSFNKYPASKRCGIISNRLQRFYENGEVHFKTGIVNEYPVVCISNRQNTRC
ncbi:COP23 domain-containing protein, partial [Cylindrospermopsis raciborskii]|uniref:COP23 domain-containing protein n=2 Tax=Cylindrospermopsis raciborskii TaxID=77022 RepID=UPI001CA5D850